MASLAPPTLVIVISFCFLCLIALEQLLTLALMYLLPVSVPTRLNGS